MSQKRPSLEWPLSPLWQQSAPRLPNLSWINLSLPRSAASIWAQLKTLWFSQLIVNKSSKCQSTWKDLPTKSTTVTWCCPSTQSRSTVWTLASRNPTLRPLVLTVLSRSGPLQIKLDLIWKSITHLRKSPNVLLSTQVVSILLSVLVSVFVWWIFSKRIWLLSKIFR